MCMEKENGEEITINSKEKNDILKAVQIIKKFGIDIKFFKKLFLTIQTRMTEEKQERKEADKEIKDNYLERFKKLENKMDAVDGNIKKQIKIIDTKIDNLIITNSKDKIDSIKNINKNLWKFIFMILGSTLVLFITMTWDKIILFLEKLL